MEYNYNSYRIIAEIRNEKVLFYEEAGSYQGDWVMLAYKNGKYLIYKDYYGSCSGCDSLQANSPETPSEAKEFAKDYKPFIQIPEKVAVRLSKKNELITILPKNIRDEGWTDITWPAAIVEFQKIILFHQKQLEPLKDALSIKNIEVRRFLIENYGEEKFMDDLEAEVIEENGENKLMKIDDFVFLQLKDSSTPRKYMLRVPPEIQSVLEGVAWSFDLKPEEYEPLKET